MIGAIVGATGKGTTGTTSRGHDSDSVPPA